MFTKTFLTLYTELTGAKRHHVAVQRRSADSVRVRLYGFSIGNALPMLKVVAPVFLAVSRIPLIDGVVICARWRGCNNEHKPARGGDAIPPNRNNRVFSDRRT
jgi:hypothetical protein